MSLAMNDFTRITQNPAVMGGKPCIRGLRVTVGMIVGQIGAGRSIDQLLADYLICSARMSSRRCATPHGVRRSVKSILPRRNENSRRYELVAWLGRFPYRGRI
jgi:uncharacterized protein (DUF433 family)